MSQAITLREFFQREGFTKPQALYLAEHGLIEGAKLNPYSKQWSIEAPAKLVDWLAALARPTEREPLRASASSADGVMVAVSGNHADTYPRQAVEIPALPSLADGFRVLGLGSGEAVERSEGGSAAPLASTTESAPAIYASPKVLESARSVRLAGSQLFYPVILSGAQVLLIERALAHERIGIEQWADWREFEPEAEQSSMRDLETLEAVLRNFKQATIDRHREAAYQNRAEVSL